ncbi:hypothetical protein [Tenacibaculum sp. M341]|uniref:hypothetical protein n=1 Tax=Tenacibaculum sp. M341 TaxID=2530339 RepID=UPI00104DF88E|nr:hypothetical protein [Tenacibaculum sp. M341]TCI85534.1 hypothetical protein EYW44_16365 [Tenacibaculum sp. M341]
MRKLILLLSIVISFYACSNNDNCCVNIDTNITIKYLNEEGKNLFEIENGYKESDINIYHKINGEWKKFYDNKLDTPKGISVIETENGTLLSLSPSLTTDQNSYSETKIEFSNTDADIVKAAIENSNNNTIVTKVWYNDILKWDTSNTNRTIEIVK